MFGEQLLASSRVFDISAGQHVFRQSETDHHLYVINSGLLKAYYITSEGKEHIKSFLLPGDLIGSIASSYKKLTCPFSLSCMKDSQLIQIEFDAIYDLCKKNSEASMSVIEMLLQLSLKKEQREYELLCLSATDRYLNLLKKIPDIHDLVTQNNIAYYLGITPVALSRIKGNLKSQQ